MQQTSIVSTIVKLLIASLIIGMLLTFFDITPERLLASFGETIRSEEHTSELQSH